MSTPAAPQTSAPARLQDRVMEIAKPYLAPYYLAVAGLLGAITVGFVVVVVLLVLIVTNFNVLGLIE
jgi:uncharacterized integral membrane protein